MARFRIGGDGIKIAKAGKHVDTATLNDLVYSSDWPTFRVKYTGVVTAASYSDPDNPRVSNIYDRAVLIYPEPFPAPPIVFVAGVVSPTESDHLSQIMTDPYVPGNYSYQIPWYTVNSLADRFELYLHCRFGNGSPLPDRVTKTYRYYVFDSLIEAT